MWSGPLSEGKVAVTIFNRGDTTAKITAFGNALSWSQIGESRICIYKRIHNHTYFRGSGGGVPPNLKFVPPTGPKAHTTLM